MSLVPTEADKREHEVMEVIFDCAKPSFDERRGMHLLSPGDIVRFGSTFWDVTGVELHTATDCDCVTMCRIGQLYPGEPECRVPLRMVERGTVYLRAEKK